jgi:hypothetical protein
LYEEDDHEQLTTDPTIYAPSSDGCLFGWVLYSRPVAMPPLSDPAAMSLRHLLRLRWCGNVPATASPAAPGVHDVASADPGTAAELDVLTRATHPSLNP